MFQFKQGVFESKFGFFVAICLWLSFTISNLPIDLLSFVSWWFIQRTTTRSRAEEKNRHFTLKYILPQCTSINNNQTSKHNKDRMTFSDKTKKWLRECGRVLCLTKNTNKHALSERNKQKSMSVQAYSEYCRVIIPIATATTTVTAKKWKQHKPWAITVLADINETLFSIIDVFDPLKWIPMVQHANTFSPSHNTY